MNNIPRNDLEMVSRTAVMLAAKQFAEALADTPQFREFEQACFDFRQDTDTQNAIQEFQKKQASLKALLMLKAVSEADQQELNQLQDRFYQQPTVLRYTKAQEELMSMCQEIGDHLSKRIGLDYGAACKTGGCCG
jgi:cell fate (sporulation/competence/biofilm development) regulator YlbF (YheA/YmcA/DUF963 family)